MGDLLVLLFFSSSREDGGGDDRVASVTHLERSLFPPASVGLREINIDDEKLEKKETG